MRFITEGGLRVSQKAVKICLKNGGHLTLEHPKAAGDREELLSDSEGKVRSLIVYCLMLGLIFLPTFGRFFFKIKLY